MEMNYTVQRYAATRPWARRVGQLYAQAVQLETAEQEVADLTRRELERAAQVYPAAALRIESEQQLARAFGLFCRHGRLVAHLEDGLTQALAHTRVPAHLPERLCLPADAFYLHIADRECGGALLMQHADDGAVELLLMRGDFSRAGTDWLTDAGDTLSLSLSYPGELSTVVAGVEAAWQPLLLAVLNTLALMTQPRLQLVRGWEAAAPEPALALAMHPSCAKSRQKGRSQLLKAGYQEVSYCRMDGVSLSMSDYASQGYWRRQALNDAQGGSRLVWVMPR